MSQLQGNTTGFAFFEQYFEIPLPWLYHGESPAILLAFGYHKTNKIILYVRRVSSSTVITEYLRIEEQTHATFCSKRWTCCYYHSYREERESEQKSRFSH
jgi:hypothetical protein